MMFEDRPLERVESPDDKYSGNMHKIPASFESLLEHHKRDEECKKIFSQVSIGNLEAKKFQVTGVPDLLVEQGQVFIPIVARVTFLNHSHTYTSGIQLGVTKTWHSFQALILAQSLYTDVHTSQAL
jgi:hypothetical protein